MGERNGRGRGIVVEHGGAAMFVARQICVIRPRTVVALCHAFGARGITRARAAFPIPWCGRLEVCWSFMQVAGFEVEKTQERLTLRSCAGAPEMVTGCLVLATIFVCVLALGILSVIEESQMTSANLAPGARGGWTPQGNHFAFLWVAATVIGVAVVPAVVAILYRGGPLYAFDRRAGAFSRDKTRIAGLSRIEAVCVRRLTPIEETSGRPLYQLLVLFGDGCECPLREAHHNETLEVLACEIANFVDRRVVRQVPPPGTVEMRR